MQVTYTVVSVCKERNHAWNSRALWSFPPSIIYILSLLETLNTLSDNFQDFDSFGKESFDGRLEFDVKIIPYEGDTSWVEGMILEAIECLKSDRLPKPGLDCDFCKYRKALKDAVSQFRKK